MGVEEGDLDTNTQYLRKIAGAVENGIMTLNPTALLAYGPAYYERDRMWRNAGNDTAEHRRTLLSPTKMGINIEDVGHFLSAAVSLDLNVAASWDTTGGTDYTVAANRAGKQFYYYGCRPETGSVPVIICSAAKTYPAGYTALNSRKIGTFHCLCVNAGTISGHELTGYLAGDILPRSVSDIKHQSSGLQDGMVWAGKTDFDTINHAPIWASIYHLSGSGSSIGSVAGATPKVSYTYYQFFNDLNLVGCRMLTGEEFSKLHKGTPEETSISTGTTPGTCGGKSDTAGRRILSDIGLEGWSGELWTWTSDQRLALGGADYTAAKVYSWDDILTGVGSDYGQCLMNAVIAGGSYNSGTYCGSRAQNASYRRSAAYTSLGCRAVAEAA